MQRNKYKLLIAFCFGLIGFDLSAKQLAPDQRLNRSKPVLKENRQRKTKPPQAIGVILTFHKWPSEKEQQNISKILNQDGLTLSKKFESFKALVFSWPKLKTKNKAQKVCRKLSQLKNLNYCEPDALLRPNNTPTDSKTEAGSPVSTCTADCDNQKISTQNLLSGFVSGWQNILDVLEGPCELAPSKHKLKDGKLTDYWAQEMVGADLLKEELEKAPPLPRDKFLVAVLDSPNESHNIHVQNIISHKGPQAVLPALNFSQLKSFKINEPILWYPYPVENSYKFAADQLTFRQRPSFINNSMHWGGLEDIYETMSRIIPPSILVKSAGNSYLTSRPSVHPIESASSESFDSIIVGSLSPKGVVSFFSSEGEEVHILAPADRYMTSVDYNGNYRQFSGTSGAAPLVTGSLAGFEWLSGYHPTAEEAKLLLEKTAVPTIHSVFEDPKKNGKGMLNAYKLGIVAQRLKEKCKNIHHCFKKEIRNPENYQFSAAPSVLDNVRSAFPQCSNHIEGVKEIDCKIKKSAFKKLRQAVLLDTTNVELWKQLQCIYNKEGFSENASAVETTLWALSENLPDSDAIKDPSFRRVIEGSILGVARIGDGGLEILQTLATDKDTSADVKGQVALVSGRIGGDRGLNILRALAIDQDKEVRSDVAWAAGRIGGDGGLELLQTLVTDADEELRIDAIREVINGGGDEVSQMLQTFVTNANKELKINVVRAAGKVGGDKGLKVLKPFLKETDKEVKTWVRIEMLMIIKKERR